MLTAKPLSEFSVNEMECLISQLNKRLSGLVYPYVFQEIVDEALEHFINDRKDEKSIVAALTVLYDKGCISYPNTLDKALPLASFSEVPRSLLSVHRLGLLDDCDFPDFLLKINVHDRPIAYENRDVDHHGIIPLSPENMSLGQLNTVEQWLYVKIAERYVSMFMPNNTVYRK
jgi:DNA topoisomerase IA